MKTREAVALIADAVGAPRGVWADLGAGSGTFTRALAELLGEGGRVYAVDRDQAAIAALRRMPPTSRATVVPVQEDFTRGLTLPGATEPLDGILFANALHFVRDAGRVLGRLVEALRPGGRVVLVEYDRRAASPWVPYPISVADLPALASAAGLTAFSVTATRPSAYQGVLYAAYATR
ncbi:MAG TPA: class I SAM-dependent methyltransferase [Gemmatimonadaceae bacterium]|nr:class I SAM-dependent methyltransferase [Gemmatimonadaceae bacterium]